MTGTIPRRHVLQGLGHGFGTLALTQLLIEESRGGISNERGGPVVHHRPKAKRVVQLFMAGAASHLDTFDYKPELARHHGEEADFGEPIEAFQDGLGPWLRSPWKFRPYGECGKYLSDIVAPLGNCVDDIAFIHSMVGKTGVHSQATLLQATGFQRPGFPGVGCWVSYGLGSLNDNLPTFVVMPDHRGFASNGTKNWSAAFLPAQHQGTLIWPGTQNPIRDLFPPGGSYVDPESDGAAQSLLQQFNRQHEAARKDDARLDARIRSYELAARMQLAAPDALDLAREPAYIHRMYGLDPSGMFDSEINEREEADCFGRKCLTARRLLERGVRFVQIWSGNDNSFPRRNWDSHENIQRDHGPLALGMARGTSALIRDLKQRGMLDDTVILWTTEFGRLPSSQGGTGRDHNPYVFTNWLAGGGIRGGTTYGPSDQWGYKPLDRDRPTLVYDVHATLLHLLGIDHRQLTVRHDGIDRRLTDVHGNVVGEIVG